MIPYLKTSISDSPGKLITYADYISAALYHPEFGYYMKNKQKIGRHGDFITTSNISDIFGRTFAKWFLFVCQNNHLEPVFCEVGGGNGRFAKAFMEEWHEITQTPLQYIIVESSPYHRQLQNELLGDFSFVQAESLKELASFKGIIFSNELFDALPVHVIEKNNGQLEEVMIGMNDEGELVENKVLLSNPVIKEFLTLNHLEIQEGQRIEIPLLMGTMLKDMADVLLKGFIITVDYGYTYEEWMEPARKKGSLRGYYQHKMIENVLLYPGDMDITTHIHFDYLINKGEQLNLPFIHKFKQDEFLLKTGILEELQNHYDPNPFSEVSKRNRAIRSLIMPSGMSSFFHVIIQQKGITNGESPLFPY